MKLKKGKLDTKLISKQLKLDQPTETTYKIGNKIFENSPKKLYPYMVGTSLNIAMESKLKYIYEKIQKRAHKLIISSCNQLQQRLISQFDNILEKEMLNIANIPSPKKKKLVSNRDNIKLETVIDPEILKLQTLNNENNIGDIKNNLDKESDSNEEINTQELLNDFL